MALAGLAEADFSLDLLIPRIRSYVGIYQGFVQPSFNDHVSSDGLKDMQVALCKQHFVASNHRLRGIAFAVSAFENSVNASLIGTQNNTMYQAVGMLVYILTQGVQGPFVVVTRQSQTAKWAGVLSQFLGLPSQIYDGSIKSRKHLRRAWPVTPVLVTTWDVFSTDAQWFTKRGIASDGCAYKGTPTKLTVLDYHEAYEEEEGMGSAEIFPEKYRISLQNTHALERRFGTYCILSDPQFYESLWRILVPVVIDDLGATRHIFHNQDAAMLEILRDEPLLEPVVMELVDTFTFKQSTLDITRRYCKCLAALQWVLSDPAASTAQGRHLAAGVLTLPLEITINLVRSLSAPAVLALASSCRQLLRIVSSPQMVKKFSVSTKFACF